MTQLTTPSDLIKGAHVRLHADQAAEKQDWRLLSHDGLWEVMNVKVDQRPFDTSPQTYVQLKSINRKGALAYSTIVFEPSVFEVVTSAPVPVIPQFPDPGSKLYIKLGTDEKPSPKDGLWMIEESRMEPTENGQEELRMRLKSEGRQNLSFLNIAFNEATMKPVMPENNDRKPNVEMQRKVNVFKPISFKK